MIKLSAVIITFNEAANIERCINSLKTVADEILVLDSFSTDKTNEICHNLGVKFIQSPFEGHIEQKNIAVENASNDYVLSLDADEALSKELQTDILNVKKNWEADAYSFNRLTSYCGRWIKSCGWYPDKKIRLWDRRKGKWGGENPHDKVIMDDNTTILYLKKDILHYSFPSISSHVATANNFSEIASKAAHLKGKKVIILWHIFLNPTFTFIQKFIFKRGFMDGFYGFVISAISAFSNFLKYIKLWNLNKLKKKH